MDNVKKEQFFLKIIIIIFSIFSFFTLCFADDTLHTVTNWHISKSKALSLSDVILEKNWETISDVSDLTVPKSGKDCQYLWLKGDIQITGDPSRYYGISLGRINHLYTVYLNNKEIASLTLNDIDQMFSTRHYKIPKGDLKQGKNKIYIRLGIFKGHIGGIADGISFMQKNAFKKNKLSYLLFYILFPFSMAFFFLITIILFFIIVLFSRDKRIFYYIIALNTISIVYIILLFVPYGILPYNQLAALAMVNYPISIIVFIYTYQTLYRIYLSKQNIVTIPVLLMISFIIVIHNNLLLVYPLNKILLVCLIVVFSTYQIYIITTLNSIKKDSLKFYVLLTLVGFNIIFYISAAIVSEIGNRYSNFIFVYSFTVGPIILPYLIARDYKHRWLKMELLYHDLKEQKRDNPDVSITGSSEKKLEVIIDFINNNYTSDLSREGLAQAVDVSPNYMSSLFNQYMNMRIDEYINKLRVEDAASHLQQYDLSIVDVAFSVGFESLPTFNRAFKKIYGVTPSRYRKKNSLG